MGYVEGANASNLQCLEYLSQDKCLSSLHKGLCSNPCVQVSVYKGSQWALFFATLSTTERMGHPFLIWNNQWGAH